MTSHNGAAQAQKYVCRPAGQLSTPPGAAIHTRHWQEWLDSGVAPHIIERNVRSIDDPRAIDELLNRNTDSRWRHSDQLVPGWAVNGLDPVTGERWGLGAQFKPDNPPPKLDKAGRPVIGSDGLPKVNKYLGAAGEPTEPLFLDNGTSGFWPNVLKTPATPIHVVEGAKKAAALLSRGIAAISISGCWNGQKAGKLNRLIRKFATKGRPVYLWPDQDWHDKNLVRKGWANLGRLLARAGCEVRVCTWDKNHKGIDDYLAAHPDEDVNDFIEGADEFKEWAAEVRELDREQRAGMVNLDVDGLLRLFRGLYGERLQFNELTQTCELDGEPLDPDLVHVELGDRFNVRAGRDLVVDTLTYLCKQRAYNPVTQYLDRVAAEVEPGDIETLATKYLHIPESDPLAPLYNAYLRKFLIKCVARAYRPGCKVDTALILQGRQNLWKSTFFRILGGPWFDDSMGPIESKDDLMIAHKCWIQEWGEFDYVSGQRHASQIKAFLSRQADTFRPPYGRSAKTFPRRFVICGTTNQTEFLNDPTGSRRFWVIPVTQPIDIKALEKDRDAIWASAVHAYRNGDQWWLTPDEFIQSEDANKQYQASDPWADDITAYVASRDTVTVKEILKALDVDSSQQTKAHENRIAGILKAQGWEKSRRSEGGTRQKCWKRETVVEKVVPGGATNPETPRSSTLQPGTTPLNEVVPPGTTPGVGGANTGDGLVPPLPDLVPPGTTLAGGVVPPKNPDTTGLTADLVPPGTTPSPTLSQTSEKNGRPADQVNIQVGDRVAWEGATGKVLTTDGLEVEVLPDGLENRPSNWQVLSLSELEVIP